MKKLFFALIAIVVAVSVQAQTKGSFVAGPGINYGMSTEKNGGSAYGVNAAIGYFFIDNLNVNAGLGYGWVKPKSIDAIGVFSWNAGVRYYFASKIPVGVSYVNQKAKGGDAFGNWSVDAGYSIAVSETFTIDPAIYYMAPLKSEYGKGVVGLKVGANFYF